MSCIDDRSSLPGGKYLWSRILSGEERIKWVVPLERYPYEGHWEYRYGAYLSSEAFWDSYLNNGFDIASAIAALEKVDEVGI